MDIGLKGMRVLCEQLALWPDRADAADHARYVDEATVKFGTGGGFFRNYFATFTHWSSQQRPDLAGPATVALAVQAAKFWNELSPTVQALVADASNQSLWARARGPLLDLYETEFSLFGHLADKVLRAD